MAFPKSSSSLIIAGFFFFILLIHHNTFTQWFPVNSPGTSYTLRSIWFVNSETGYAVGGFIWINNFPNEVIKTTDGGQNWNVIYSENMAIFNQILFTDELTGYLAGGLYAGGNPKLRKTTNSGINWFSIDVSYIIGSFISCSFINSATGYATSSIVIFKTTSGGLNWQFSHADSTPAVRYNFIKFIDANSGFCVGDSGKIIKTTNAGVNWIQLSSGTANTLTSLFFVDVNTGYAVGCMGLLLKLLIQDYPGLM